MPDEAAHGRQPGNTLAFILKGGSYYEPTHLNVNYATGQHTAGPVPTAVYGNGIETKPFGLIDNTDLFYLMTDALGVDYHNPVMDPAEAALYFDNKN
jgi:alkaline phosphatase